MAATKIFGLFTLLTKELIEKKQKYNEITKQNTTTGKSEENIHACTWFNKGTNDFIGRSMTNQSAFCWYPDSHSGEGGGVRATLHIFP
jgi:hypothetical protein